jgi:hypothetical protein
MRDQAVQVIAVAGLCLLGLGAGRANADVCVRVDQAHDTLVSAEQNAAVLLVNKEFEATGERIVATGCSNEYVLSHIKLGDMISVSLVGPNGRRDATAVGLDDLPAVYNQMVRSLVTGRPMSLTGVVDRTNVSVTQAAKLRVDSDNVFYARLGSTAIFGDKVYGMPSIGLLGYRHELDTFAVDVTFLDFNMKTGGTGGTYGADESGVTFEWLRLRGLRYTNAYANQSLYFGGGIGYGTTSVSKGSTYNSTTYRSPLHGSGLDGELTVGYEIGRASTVRVMLQADATLPFYSLQSTEYAYTRNYSTYSSTTSTHYSPSLTFSVALGWQRGAHTHR